MIAELTQVKVGSSIIGGGENSGAEYQSQTSERDTSQSIRAILTESHRCLSVPKMSSIERFYCIMKRKRNHYQFIPIVTCQTLLNKANKAVFTTGEMCSICS
jgi:hypothetical protein